MGKKEKLLAKILNNPVGINYEDFKTLLKQCGWKNTRQKGSHEIWKSPKENMLVIQPTKDSKVKPYQVKQFIGYYNKEAKNEK